MAIDTTIQFNGHNSYKVTELLLAYPFGVQNMTYITHSFQVYCNSPLASATRAKTKYIDADGATISEFTHAFAVPAVFEKVEITVAVPATAVQAQLVFLHGGTDWWFAEPKSEEGQTSTPYNVNYAGQMTYITPNGIYTGMVTANQIVVTGSINNPSEDLETRLVTINQNAVNLSAAVGSQGSRLTTVEAGQITLTSTVDGVVSKTTKITSAGVYTGEIVASQITAGTIDAARIATGSITGAKLADTTITGTKIANTTITGNKIATGTITANQIAANTITGDKIAANTITASKINVTDLAAERLSGISTDTSSLELGPGPDANTSQARFTIPQGFPDGVTRDYMFLEFLRFGTTSTWIRKPERPYYGSAGSLNIISGNSRLSLWDVDGNVGDTRLYGGTNENNYLGVDQSGPYYVKNGVRTDFT